MNISQNLSSKVQAAEAAVKSTQENIMKPVGASPGM